MVNENTELQREIEEIQKEYEELREEIRADIAAESRVSDTQVHLFNITLGVIMIFIGGFLAYQTRKQVQKSGKKIAGWILLIVGALALITHVIQLIF